MNTSIIGGGSSPTNVIYQALRRSPTDKTHNDDGTFYETDNLSSISTLWQLSMISKTIVMQRLLANMSLDVNFHKNLKGWVNLAYTRDDDESLYFEPSQQHLIKPVDMVVGSYNNRSNKLLESTLTYLNTFNEKHNFSLMGGYSWKQTNSWFFRVAGRNATSDYIGANNLGSFLDVDTERPFGYKREDLLIAFFSLSTV